MPALINTTLQGSYQICARSLVSYVRHANNVAAPGAGLALRAFLERADPAPALAGPGPGSQPAFWWGWSGISFPTPCFCSPLGATAVLVFAVPSSPLAQPWNCVVGNTVPALYTLLLLWAFPALSPDLLTALAVAEPLP